MESEPDGELCREDAVDRDEATERGTLRDFWDTGVLVAEGNRPKECEH